MTFRIRDLGVHVWTAEQEGMLLTCPAASCAKSHIVDPPAESYLTDLALLQQQLQQSLSLER